MARGPHPWLAPAVLVGSLAPAVSMVMRARTGGLGSNPIAEALNELGLTALILLIASLAATPLKMLTGWTWPIRIRRRVGVLAFAYAVLHVTVYVALDQSFAWRGIVADVIKRNFILVGFAAFTLLVPLAVTSTDWSVRRLGYVKWKRLHTLVYPAAMLAAIHFIWRVKKDLTEPLVYAAVLGLFLLLRVVWRMRKKEPAVRLSAAT
jgi:methionine sulfoxide reductase heme-binding subunit